MLLPREDYLNVMVHVCDSFLKDKRLTLPHVGSTHQTLRAGALRSRPYAEPPRRRSRLCAEPPRREACHTCRYSLENIYDVCA